MYNTIKFLNDKMSINSFIEDLNNKIINIDRSFQRKNVWNDLEMKQELIISILLGMPTGNIIIWNTEDEDKKGLNIQKIVDGQQRILTIDSFLKNEFCLNSKNINKILKNNIIYRLFNNYLDTDNKIKKIYENQLNNENQCVKFCDLPDFLQRQINTHQLSLTILSDINEKHVREYFKVLQNQEKLKAGEILNSFHNKHVLQFLTKDEIDSFCSITNFNDERMGFYKHFTVFLGLLSEKKSVRMGMTDKNIVKIAEKIDIDNIENDILFQKTIKYIKNDILNEKEEEVEVSKKEKGRKLSVLGLKLFLWSYVCFNEKDFEIYIKKSLSEKSDIFKKITILAGFLNSKDVEFKKNELINKFSVYNDYDKDKLYKGVENAWKLGKTTHSKNDLHNFFKDIFYLAIFLLKEKNFKII